MALSPRGPNDASEGHSHSRPGSIALPNLTGPRAARGPKRAIPWREAGSTWAATRAALHPYAYLICRVGLASSPRPLERCMCLARRGEARCWGPPFLAYVIHRPEFGRSSVCRGVGLHAVL